MGNREVHSMSANEIREFVVKAKDEDGMTYDEIGSKLEELTGTSKSRQAVYKIYKRAKDSSTNKDRDRDVINLKVLGYNKTEILNILYIKYENDITYSRITKILSNEEEIEKVRLKYIKKVAKLISEGKGIAEIKQVIEYDGINGVKKGEDKIIANAYAMVINQDIKRRIAQAIKMTDNSVNLADIIDNIDTNVRKAECLNVLNECSDKAN